MEIYGVPPDEVIKLGVRKHLFFEKGNKPILQENSRGKKRIPASKSIEGILRCTDDVFIDFLDKCFDWNPMKRMTPVEALNHPWIQNGSKVDNKLLKSSCQYISQEDAKDQVKNSTLSDVQGFPKGKKNNDINDIVKQIKMDD